MLSLPLSLFVQYGCMVIALHGLFMPLPSRKISCCSSYMYKIKMFKHVHTIQQHILLAKVADTDSLTTDCTTSFVTA